MATRSDSKTLTTQEQVNEFIIAEIEAITIDTISDIDLGKDLIESDLDMILCMKDKYRGDAFQKHEEDQEIEYFPGEELTLNEKQDKVTDILDVILEIEEVDLDPTDRDILDLALTSRLIAEKARKQKELKSEFSKGFAGLILKNKVKASRLALKESYEYQDATDKIDVAMKARRERSKEKKVERICKTVEKVANDCQKHIKDEETMAQLKTLLNKAFKVKTKKKTSSKKKSTIDEPKLEEVTSLVNSDVEADKVIEDINQTIVEEKEELNGVISLNTKVFSTEQKETAGVRVKVYR